MERDGVVDPYTTKSGAHAIGVMTGLGEVDVIGIGMIM
jgi:hypothetical protein